jgi:enediyne biosynthesis protein E4
MKKLTTSLFFALCSFISVNAQQFTKVTIGDIVNTPSDSRSVNLVDVNNDGWDDIFITNGPKTKMTNFLYMNNGDGTFTTVASDDIVSDSSAFDGATFGDVDNDGDLDAYVVTWYGLINYFYRNNGDGTFTYEPEGASGSVTSYSETASFGDYDNDGGIDLYVTNSDSDFLNLLYRNVDGDSFMRINTGPMVTDANASRCVNWVDYDNDNDADIFVTNESNQRDDLYRNDGNGVFTKITNIAPALLNRSTMSASWGDIDNDGDLDLFVANSLFFTPQNNQLFINNGDGTFTAVTTGAAVTDGGCSYTTSFSDYDNDGDLDLFVGNGYCNGVIENFLYLNDGAGNFSRDTNALPDYATPCSYGAAWADLDHNGFEDLVIATCKNKSTSPLAENMMFMNNGNANHWINIKLTGTVSNRSAIGAKVYVTANINGQTVKQMREISAQTGYCGQNSMTAHFGLKDAATIEKVEVKWPAGNTSLIENINADTTITIVETNNGTINQYNHVSVSVTVYPNPAKNKITFRINNPENTELKNLKIVDATGRILFTQELNSHQKKNEFTIPLQLPNGQYLGIINTDKGLTGAKFIIN